MAKRRAIHGTAFYSACSVRLALSKQSEEDTGDGSVIVTRAVIAVRTVIGCAIRVLLFMLEDVYDNLDDMGLETTKWKPSVENGCINVGI